MKADKLIMIVLKECSVGSYHDTFLFLRLSLFKKTVLQV